VSDRSPDATAVAIQRAAALCDLSRFRDAAQALERVIASDPGNASAWTLLARAQIGSREYEQALQSATTASSMAPENEWPHRLASIALTSLGRDREGAASARKAIGLAPHNYAGYMVLAQALARNPYSHDQAEVAASKACELAPNEPSAYVTAGVIAAAAGRRDAAAERFHVALAIDPQNARALNELARLNIRRGGLANANPRRLASAASGFAAAIRANPHSDIGRRNLDAVMGSFLALTAYFVSVNGFVAIQFAQRDAASTGIAGRIIPLALLAIPAGFALLFVLRLPADLRPYLLETLSTRRNALASALEAIAIVALIASCLVPDGTRPALAVVAIVAAVLGRIALWRGRKRAVNPT
jgi:tetratricopeptide (TPR) repeat protein